MAVDFERAYERLLESPGVVMLLGALDTGKTTFGLELARRAAAAGVSCAIVDADIVQSTVGPPTTVGLKLLGTHRDLTREGLRPADGLGFVGTLIPKGHLLPLISSTAKLARTAATSGAELII